MRFHSWVHPLRPFHLTLLSAFLLVASFPPWNMDFLIWIALVPWFAALKRAASPGGAFLQGVWLSFFMTIGGFFWVAFAIREFGGVPLPLAILGLFLFGLFNQPQFLMISPLIDLLNRRWGHLLKTPGRTLCSAVILGLLYSGLDWLIPKLFLDTLGHSLYQVSHLRQLAEVGGAHLLTFLIFLVNWTIWRSLDHFLQTKRIFSPLAPSWLLTAFAALLVASGIFWGVAKRDEIRRWTHNPPKTLQMGVIQGNIGDFDKLAAEKGIRDAAEKVLRTLFTLSDTALALTPTPDVLVWPETSYPSTFRTPQTTDEFARDQSVGQYVKDRKTPLLFGGYDHAFNKDFNSFFFLTPVHASPYLQTDLQIYHKSILLLFGEYIPFSDQIEWLRTTFPQVGNFGRGPGPVLLKVHAQRSELGTVLTNPIICYEALFPSFILEAARRGSQFILNITNDSWFGPWGEPHLHLALSIFRSIESRLPQVRSTNTGISALIHPDGEIVQRTPIGEATIMNVGVPLLPPKDTLLKSWGDWFGWAALIAGVLGAFGLLNEHLLRPTARLFRRRKN